MAASDVPGEHLAGTQPIPLKPPPIARVGYAPDDLVTRDDTTAAHADFCRALRERSGGLQKLGAVHAVSLSRRRQAAALGARFPRALGGANWGGLAADPALGFVFVNTSDVGSLGWLDAVPDDAAASPGRVRRSRKPRATVARARWAARSRTSGGAPRRADDAGAGERAWPCQKPPWGQLLAVNAGDRRDRLGCPARHHRAASRQRNGGRAA